MRIGDRVTVRNVSTGKLRNPERRGAVIAPGAVLEVTWSTFWIKRLRDLDVELNPSPAASGE